MPLECVCENKALPGALNTSSACSKMPLKLHTMLLDRRKRRFDKWHIVRQPSSGEHTRKGWCILAFSHKVDDNDRI